MSRITRFLAAATFAVMAPITAMTATAVPAQAFPVVQGADRSGELLELKLINDERIRLGLQPLLWDEAKYPEAKAWSDKMGSHQIPFSHNTRGYYYNHFGENLAATNSVPGMVKLFMDEKGLPVGSHERGHYESLTYPKFRYATVAISRDPYYGLVSTVYVSEFKGAAPARW